MFIRLNFRLKKKKRGRNKQAHDRNLFDIRFSYAQVTHTYIYICMYQMDTNILKAY
jgi:hypothetical protein